MESALLLLWAEGSRSAMFTSLCCCISSSTIE